MNTSPARALRAFVSFSALALTFPHFAHATHENAQDTLVSSLRLTEIGPSYRELTNIGQRALDLSTLVVQDAQFPDAVILPPGESVVITPDAAAFTQAYGAGKPVYELQPAGFNYSDAYSAFSLRDSNSPEAFFQFAPAAGMFGPGSQWEVNDPTGDISSFHSITNWRPDSPTPGSYLPFLPTKIDTFDMPTLGSAWVPGDWKLSSEHRRQYSLTEKPGSLTFRLNEAANEVSGMHHPLSVSPCAFETRVVCNDAPAGSFAGIAYKSGGYWSSDHHLFGIADGNMLRISAPDGSILAERPVAGGSANIRILHTGGQLLFELSTNNVWQRVLTISNPPPGYGDALFAKGPAQTRVSFRHAKFYSLGSHTVDLKGSLAISEAGGYYREITNIGRKTLLLDSLYISGDVGEWKATPGSFLQPGCSAVLTHNLQAHRQRFGAAHQVIELIGENFPGVGDTHWFSAEGYSDGFVSLFQSWSGTWISAIDGNWNNTGQPVDLHNPNGAWEGGAPSPGVYKGNRNLGGNLQLTEVAADFMELSNFSGKTLYLDSLVLSDGSQSWSPPTGTVLEPFMPVILVQNLSAFRQQFGPSVRVIEVPASFPLNADTLTFSTPSEGVFLTWQRQLFTSAINGDLSKSAQLAQVWDPTGGWTANTPNPGILPGVFERDAKKLKLTEASSNYVELTNFGAKTFLLDGLIIVAEGGTWSIPAGFMVGPGCSIILTPDVAAFHQTWGAGIPAAPLSGATIYPNYSDSGFIQWNGQLIDYYTPFGSYGDPSQATPGYYVPPPFQVQPLQTSVSSFDTIVGASIWFSAAENFYSPVKPINPLWNIQGPASVSVSHDWPDYYGVEDRRLLKTTFQNVGIYDVSFSASIPESNQQIAFTRQVTIARPDDLDRFSVTQLRGYWKIYNAENSIYLWDYSGGYSTERTPGKLDIDSLVSLPFPRAEIEGYAAPRIMRPLPGRNCSIQVNVTTRYSGFTGLYACSRGYLGAQYAFGWEGNGVVVYRSLSQENSTPAEVFRQSAVGQGLRIRATDAGLLFQIRNTEAYGIIGEWTTVWTDPTETTLSEAGPAVAAALPQSSNRGIFDDVLVIDASTLPESLKLTGMGPDFYQLTNIGATALDLTHLKFADGSSILDYAPLPPGKSILIVENAAQFTRSTSAQVVEVPGMIATSRQANLFTLTAPGRLQTFLSFTPSTVAAAQNGAFELINLQESVHQSWNWRTTSNEPGAWLPDIDGDGISDSTEIRFGTNPYDRDSRHYLNASRSQTGALILQWPTANGQSYVVEYCETLGQPWQPLATLVGQGAPLTFTDATHPAPPTRFYRIKAP